MFVSLDLVTTEPNSTGPLVVVSYLLYFNWVSPCNILNKIELNIFTNIIHLCVKYYYTL